MIRNAIQIQKAKVIFHLGREPTRLWGRFPILLAILLVSLGAVIRIHDLGVNNLWFDEAMVWFISRGSPGEIVSANARLNSAPPTYPLLIGLVGNLWGTSEAQLRSLSVLAGLAALVGITLLARRWLSWVGVIFALAIMVFAPAQVAYSRELREYSFVTLFTILVFLTLDWMLEATENYRRVVTFTLVSCAALSFQFGLVIIVACAQLIYLGSSLRERRRISWLLFVGSSACLVGAAVVVIISSLSVRIQSRSLVFSYLASQYLQEWSIWGIARHLWVNTVGLLNFGSIENAWLVFGSLALIGALTFLKGTLERRRVLLYIVLPFIIVVVLSLLKLYPYGGVRQDFLLLPMLYVASAAGVEYLARRFLPSQALRIFLLAVLLLGWAALTFWSRVLPMYRSNFNGENLQSYLVYLAQHLAPGDSIYVYRGAAPAFRYYWQERKLGDSHSDAPIIFGRDAESKPERYLPQVEKCVEQSSRCWLVFSHNYNTKLSEQKLIID